MEENLKISLIIPAYNEEKYIGSCLEHALKNSDGKFFEIIVIDNASTDRTGEIAKSFHNIRVVREENKGLTKARQRGFVESSGNILANIDADTRLPRGWVDQIIKEFKKDKNLVCLSGPYIYYDIPSWQSLLVKIFWVLAIPVYWITGYMATGGNHVIKRETLEKMNGFDTKIEFFGEDTNTARRASKYGKVKFKLKFAMPTSGRRLIKDGFLKSSIIYISQFLSETVVHKPVVKKHKDIR